MNMLNKESKSKKKKKKKNLWVFFSFFFFTRGWGIEQVNRFTKSKSKIFFTKTPNRKL